MANPIRINAATLNRPGVFVTQASTGGLPQPIATHAVGYLFGTTPTEDYYGEDAVNAYSLLEPYKPTQIGSVADYLDRIGGSVPVGNKGALATYDAIKAFFDNVGVNGILYFTRVSPTPETVIDIAASNAGAGYNAFALKVNGRYFGTPIGVNDSDGDEIRVITTTALDQVDNARDIYAFLANNGDGFADYYRIEQTAAEATAGKFRIFSRDTRNLPIVDRFVSYQFSDTQYASPVNLDTPVIVKLYTSVKEINFRCISRDQQTGEPVTFVSGSQLSAFLTEVSTPYSAAVVGFDALNDKITLGSSTGLANGDKVVLEGTAIGTLGNLSFNTIYYVVGKTGNDIQLATTSGGLAINFSGAPGAAVTVRKLAYNPATEQSSIIKAFLIDQNVYASAGDIPDTKIVAISKDLTSGALAHVKWADANASYWEYNLSGTSFSEIQSGGQDAVPSGEIATVGGVTTRTGYLPDSVQVFYVNVAGEDRAIIVNGATPDELAEGLKNEIEAILVEKELDGYYTVEAVATGTNVTGDTHVPNNGHDVSLLVSEAGAPYIRPELADVSLSGTVGITSGVVAGTGTQFTSELAVGDIFVVKGVRFTVQTITDDDTATVFPANVNITAGNDSTISLDKSLPNGFYAHDYVLRVKITSNNGVSSPVNPGSNRFGVADPNVIKLISTDQNAGYEGYKLTQTSKSHDFVYAIEQGMDSKILSPGFLFAPEAYTILVQEVGGDIGSKAEARSERRKITQALVKAAEGKLGPTEGISGTQHIALIDCGADELALTQVQDELDLIKSTVGVPFGHAAYYAPYIKNLEDRYVAPSSFIAGIACSRYINEGFQQPPAGARYALRGVNGLRFDISAQQQEVTYALGLNPIRSLPNRGIVAWGARTLSPNPLFKFVNTRAILNVLIDVMGRSFDDILFEQIDSAGTVYARVKSIASQILGQFFRQGALFGSRPEQAYLVVCSSANNNNVDLENGSVRLDVYVATSPTLERLLVTIVRTPAGQVTQLSDSFSRNEERFSYLLNTTTVF